MWLKTGNAQAIPQSSSLLESEQCFVIVKFAQQLLQEFLLGPGDAESLLSYFFFLFFTGNTTFWLRSGLSSPQRLSAEHGDMLAQSRALRAPASVSAGFGIKGLCCHS